MGKIIQNGIEYSGTYSNATSINYDGSVSGLSAKTVQEAIDKIAAGGSVIPDYGNFTYGTYSNEQGTWTKVDKDVLVLVCALREDIGYLRTNLAVKNSENEKQIVFNNCMYNHTTDASEVHTSAFVKAGGYYNANYCVGTTVKVQIIPLISSSSSESLETKEMLQKATMAEFMIVEIQSSLWICENAEDRKSNISRINKVEKNHVQ